MKEQILKGLSDYRELEKLYRSNKSVFKKEFNELHPDLKGNLIADFWFERLNHENDEINWGTSKDLVYIILAAFFAALISKIPLIFSIDQDYFFGRNVGFVVFPILASYFAWKNKLSAPKIIFVATAMLAGLVFINLLPDLKKSDTLVLSSIHLILFLWSVLGFTFVASHPTDQNKRLQYLKYNGDMVVMTALILIAGMIMTGITLGLFGLLGLHIEKFYGDYVIVSGLSAAPILATYLTQTNPQLVGKVSPVIAKLFSPLVLVMLVVYLIAIVYSGKNPYNNRDFLIMFNALLVGVLAIIFFSIAESGRSKKSKAEVWILFILAILTIIVNAVALSAIIFRISEWGITPNRTAVLGGNVLILINLLLVTTKLFNVVTARAQTSDVGKVIASYLPVYAIWTIIVTFLFPFLFGFK